MVVKTFYQVVELAFSWFPLNVFHAKVSLFVPHACTYLSSIQRTYEVKTCVQRPSSYLEAMVPWFSFARAPPSTFFGFILSSKTNVVTFCAHILHVLFKSFSCFQIFQMCGLVCACCSDMCSSRSYQPNRPL